MLRKEAWLTLAFTLIAVWVSYVAGSGVAAWGCGFLGIVILAVLLAQSGEKEEPSDVFGLGALTEKSFRLGEIPASSPTPLKEESPSFLFVFGAPLGENDSPVWIMMLKHYGPITAFNCDIQFYDDDRKNIEHRWLVEHPNSSFLPSGGVVGQSQIRFQIPEAGPEGAPEKFKWTPIDPNNQHYTVSISCRDGVFVEKWEITRVDGILRTKITIEHGPQWVEKNPMQSPVVFTCTEPGFISTPLAAVVPAKRPQPVNPGWKPNHRVEFPVAIIDPNGNLQVGLALDCPMAVRRPILDVGICSQNILEIGNRNDFA